MISLFVVLFLRLTFARGTQVAMYKERTSGKCGDSGGGWGKITSADACGAGAVALNLSHWLRNGDTTAYTWSQFTYPPGCSYGFPSGGRLWFNTRHTDVACTEKRNDFKSEKGLRCLCTLTCQPGTYQDQSGQSSCKTCASGRHQAQSGQSSCKSCASGKYNNQDGQSSCKTCASGQYQYQDQNGTSSCKTCPSQQYQDQSGQSSCKTCANNTFSYAGASLCCQAKHFANGTTCEKCPWRGQCYHVLNEYPTSRLVVVDSGDGRTAYSGKRYTLNNWIQNNTQTNVGLYDAPLGQIDFDQNCTTGDVFVQTESQCRDVAWFVVSNQNFTVTQDSSKRVGCYSSGTVFSFNTFANQPSNLTEGLDEWCRKLVRDS